VLWDADGVLQHLPAGWEASMRPAERWHVDAGQPELRNLLRDHSLPV
jgi:hypothetical protein